MTIYEIKDEFLKFNDFVEELQEKVEEEGREMTLEEQNQLINFLEENDKKLEEKLDAYGRIIKNLEADALAVDAELKRLFKRKKAAEGLARQLKSNLNYVFKQMNIKERKTELFKFKMQKNPPSLVWDSTENVPPEFIKGTEVIFDNKKLLDCLKAGEKYDFAHLEQEESLRIK